VSGDLTLHGVTKPIKLTVEKTGSGKSRGTEILGFETTFTIKRSEFGITYGPEVLGDEVRITASVEAKRK
jgi:polyisoprenoid-binding protein YceI